VYQIRAVYSTATGGQARAHPAPAGVGHGFVHISVYCWRGEGGRMGARCKLFV